MPLESFICPDGEEIKITDCLNVCRMPFRCATKPYLRLIGYDRKWKGVSPSSAGNGPRLLYLKATENYAVDPQSRVWAAFGTSTHDNLGMHRYSYNVLSEQPLSDSLMKGIADVLEEDESIPDEYVLTDYKTWGSFKVAKALGMIIKKEDVPILENGKPVSLKSGKNKGKVKTKIKSTIVIDPAKIDLKSEELQINRYRMFFEHNGFPISKMQIQAIPRDGGTYIAKNRGIEKNLYIIPVKKVDNFKVNSFYDTLQREVEIGFETGFARKCNDWESWENRRCDGYCEVSEDCKSMTKIKGE